MSNPVTFPRGCPVCRGTVAFDASTALYRCQNEGCDYSRRTLHPAPKDLVVKMTGQPPASENLAPANIVSAVAAAPTVTAETDLKDSYILAELVERWGVTEATARKRLVKYGGQETVASYKPIPREVVEKVEAEVASWGAGGEPQETAVVVADSQDSTFGIIQLAERWKISESGVYWRLRNVGNRTGVSRASRFPLNEIEHIERTMAERQAAKTSMMKYAAPKVAAAVSTPPRVETVRAIASEAPVPAERALVPTEKHAPPTSDLERRITRLRLTLQRIHDVAGKGNPLIAELARLALDLDAVEG